MESTDENDSRSERAAPFVLLPEVAGERDEQHGGKRPESRPQPYPELHTRARQRLLLGQGRPPDAQLGFAPNIEHVLRTEADRGKRAVMYEMSNL